MKEKSPMPTVELQENEWQAVVNILVTAPWRDANPLLMKITSQLQAQQQQQQPLATAHNGNGQTLENDKL